MILFSFFVVQAQELARIHIDPLLSPFPGRMLGAARGENFPFARRIHIQTDNGARAAGRSHAATRQDGEMGEWLNPAVC
jgi:hypothetical protein